MLMTNNIPIIGFYSDHNEVTLTGTSEDFVSFAQSLVFSRAQQCFTLYVPDETPDPYAGFLRELQVLSSACNIHITLHNDALTLMGSYTSRQALAHKILQFVKQPEESTQVIVKTAALEHYPDHPFLEKTSAPLLLSLVNVRSCNQKNISMRAF